MFQPRDFIETGEEAATIASPSRRDSEAVFEASLRRHGHDTVTVVGDRAVPRSWEIAKRLMDVVIALVLLLLVSPLVLVAMVAIVVSSPGPPLFLQKRIGRYGRQFSVYKLRTMVTNAHSRHDEIRHLADVAVAGPVIKLRQDPRVFPVGRFLRRTSIDELPNLLNVLKGDMSLVGPRPMQASEIERCAELFGEAATQRRLAAHPGITCLWQISGRSNIRFDERIQLDIDYASTWTPVSDLRILVATIPAVLSSRGAY